MSRSDRARTGPRLAVMETVRLRRAELGTTLTELERALEAAPHERPRVLRAALTRLRRDFRDHVAVAEGPTGLHEQVLTDAPRLSARVRMLQREHGELRDAIEEALEKVEGAAWEGESLRAAVGTLLRHLSRHRRRGADLVHEAYQVDLGGAGD